MKNRIKHLLEAEEKSAVQPIAEFENRNIRHRRLMTVCFLDDQLMSTGEAVLTRDQHGRYWVNKSRLVSPSEAVAWYGDALFGGAAEMFYENPARLQELFRIAVRG